ncbi:MAG: threonine synthase [Candidatus Bathyarchaeota archaeon]|nr:threonine synthase [Candidatus Bathyarchaeota archaeon]
MSERYYLTCIGCGSKYDPNNIIYKCYRCGDLLSVEYSGEVMKAEIASKWNLRDFTVWRYAELLPVSDKSKIVSLGEGGTSLNKCVRLGCEASLKNIYVKNEGENPTGSFKDRGMTVGVTKALELGMKRVACASTGNTSASLAAYAARAGLECMVLIPSGKVAFGKLIQAIVHGAKVIQVKGNFDEALKIVEEICATQPVYLLNSINPYRLEGQKTIAFEIWDQLHHNVPDKVIVPVGNAGNISAIWKGFKELYAAGLTEKLPEMIGIQAEGAAPIATFIRERLEKIRFVEKPETVATAIRIGSPVNWKKAVRAIEESNGLAETVSDEEILSAQRLLAQREGIFVEPAGAAAVAGLIKLADMKLIDRDEVVVCILTGHGLKDPDIILKQFSKPVEIEADIGALIKMLSLNP